jgi:membrane fusion protein (multidrug efflux system)
MARTSGDEAMSESLATTVEPHTAAREAGRAAPLPAAGAAPPAPAPRGGRRRLAFALMGLALAALAALGVRRWIFSLSHESTDNAQVDGHIVPILPKVGGFVTEIRVEENQRVQAGDTLVVLDDRDYRARLAQAAADLAVALAGVSNRARVGQAEAQVAQAEANAAKAHADLERLRPLAARDIVSKQQLDAAEAAARAADAAVAAAQAALAGADARVAAARAARDQAALNLSYTRITAPAAGVVTKKTVELGQLVQPGQPLMSVVPLEDVWITANLKETQIADVRPGEPVEFTVDAYPGLRFRGHVESIAPATGARFSLLPPDNATGNFTKVVQRVPVRIRPDTLDPARPLRPGMSVVVTIRTK